MEMIQFIHSFWECVTNQDEKELLKFFSKNARVRWHCSNEEFTAEEYIKANCEYPDEWNSEVERFEQFGDLVITAVRVWTNEISFHACSFFKMEGMLIKELDEYWGAIENVPDWRVSLGIGKSIKNDI